MSPANRTLSADVIAALTYWPGSIVPGRKFPPKPVDLTVLPPFFNDLLQDLPWWNRDWKVTHVEPACPWEVASHHDRSMTRFTEVSVPGIISTDTDTGDALPFFAKVRLENDQL